MSQDLLLYLLVANAEEVRHPLFFGSLPMVFALKGTKHKNIINLCINLMVS